MQNNGKRKQRPNSLIVQARIEGGALKVPNRKVLLAALKGWPDCAVDLSIAPFEETRRAQANAFLWSVVYKMIAQETGHSSDDLHEFFKLKHNGKVIEVTNPATGEVTETRIGMTTTKLTIRQFSDYIESVMLDGAEWCGIVFPEPRASQDYREKEAAA